MGTVAERSRGVGLALAGVGAVSSALLAGPRAAFSLDGGFEHHARDLSVPLVVLACALFPALAWALACRLGSRPSVALVVALAALGLGLWGALEWWSPRQHPDPGYGPGI
ncbi:hypothetical protein [Streptomyces profundus]|uniref:hypothetical protein n=1 Tax=Streptomyces profundus TaxID=2867410 RepID=UPI001D167801|nr:hypothetical protein [Streptomyces sp. MA3_2.13]UED85926.1 hypothetical protein K4G22_18485 [Streptomyces sp. MA3_2.13]